ncbi:MAG: hypothetical protein FJ206_03805 [Gemmatimonadetes bacterium]|nr:hypothetical protein [Gemmatimonadota bacterium]
MKYFHRTSLTPDEVIASAASYFGARMGPTHEGRRARRFSSGLGQVSITVEAEGGHYTLIGIETDQPGESELDKVAKRFLTTVHAQADRRHVVRGAY